MSFNTESRKRTSAPHYALRAIPAVRANHPNRLLAGLQPDELAALTRETKYVPLAAGDILHDVGQPIENIYFIHSGFVSLVTVLQNGKAIENAMVGNEGAIGTKAAFGRDTALVRAVVRGSGAAGKVTVAAFRSILAELPILRERISRFNEVLVAQIQQNAACNVAHNLDARLSRWLLYAADHTDGRTVHISQENLAQTLGVHRGRVNGVLRTMQVSGSIDYRQRCDITIRREGLEGQACECYRVVGNLMRCI